MIQKCIIFEKKETIVPWRCFMYYFEIVRLYTKYLLNLTFLDSSNEMWNMNTKIAWHLHHFLIIFYFYYLRLLHLSLTRTRFMKKWINTSEEWWSVPEGSAVVSQWSSPSLRWIHAQRPWSKEQPRCPVSVEHHTMDQKYSWQELNTIYYTIH